MLTRILLTLVLLGLAMPTASAQSLAGRWPNGLWTSDTTHHRGPLHAQFQPLNDSQYLVQFGGRFAKVIPFRYTVVLDVVGTSGDAAVLSGSSRLPLFGTFHYNATATPTHFDAHYTNRRYSGQFLLSR
jgi:hypothetical protein